MDLKAYIRPGRGAADITPLLGDGAVFRAVIDRLAALFDGTRLDRVACVEGRGFLVGSALAYRLGVGLAPVRQADKLKAAGNVYAVSYTDYSRTTKTLAMPIDAVAPGERVLIVDDWVETAATVMAVITIVERAGSIVAGIATLMDDTMPNVRDVLSSYNYRYLMQTTAADRF